MNTFLKENFFKFMIGLSALIVSIAFLMYVLSITTPPKSKVDIMIGDPIRLEKLEVAQYDFPKNMTLDDAKNACRQLGNGWRLPNKNELHLLYKNKDKIGGFYPEWYISSSTIAYYDGRQPNACFIDFETGRVVLMSRIYDGYVRAVRTF